MKNIERETALGYTKIVGYGSRLFLNNYITKLNPIVLILGNPLFELKHWIRIWSSTSHWSGPFQQGRPPRPSPWLRTLRTSMF